MAVRLDYFGNKVLVGDLVAFVRSNELYRGRIIGFTPANAEIKNDKYHVFTQRFVKIADDEEEEQKNNDYVFCGDILQDECMFYFTEEQRACEYCLARNVCLSCKKEENK